MRNHALIFWVSLLLTTFIIGCTAPSSVEQEEATTRSEVEAEEVESVNPLSIISNTGGGDILSARNFYDSPYYVWTGSKMCFWSGEGEIEVLALGGSCYDPENDSWSAMTTENAPEERWGGTVVWTGTEMCIWGGYLWDPVTEDDELLDTGACYNPETDTWTTITNDETAPSARYGHAAIWTGSKMCILMGGDMSEDGYALDGKCYDPATQLWSAMAGDENAPSERIYPYAAYYESKICVWGGGLYDEMEEWDIISIQSGSCYNLETESWTAMSTENEPAGRMYAPFHLLGSKMCVWGGQNSIESENAITEPGGCYDIESNSWSLINTSGAPTARVGVGSVSTDTEICIYGGFHEFVNGEFNYGLDNGGCYNPETDSWRDFSYAGMPGVGDVAAVYTGSKICMWGGLDYFELDETGEDIPENFHSTDVGVCLDLTAL